jgi:squalene synthase HpnC
MSAEHGDVRQSRADPGDTVGSRAVPTVTYLRERRQSENFPVALRVLPRDLRTHLGRLYDVARVIDDAGDQASGDRTAGLLALRADLDTIWAGGTPVTPALRELAATVRECGLTRKPFADLIEANLRDQTVTTYQTYEDLLGYCALSANPVGRLVLEVFGAATPQRVAWSDRVCSALQIIEHCQDVGEDCRAGRIYLPREDLERFGVSRRQLGTTTCSPQLRHLIEFEAERAAGLLDEGRPLLRELRGWARLAVSGYVAGGRAAVAALRRGGWSVLPKAPRAGRSSVAATALAVLAWAALPAQQRGVS